MRAYMNWSGGKDSALALYKVQEENLYQTEVLLTNVNMTHNRVSMHGVRRQLLQQQAALIGIPLETIELPEHPGMDDYENKMREKLTAFRERGLSHAIFGDIFLEDLRQYRENKLKEVEIETVFPLWKIDTKELMTQFLALGFKSIIVCVNELFLDKSFCGRIIDEEFVRDLPPGVDICGENGEYHSFVFDGPLFSQPVAFSVGEIVHRTYPAPQTGTGAPKDYGFYFCDLY